MDDVAEWNEQGDDQVMVATARPKPETRRRRQPNYAVILENDECHTFPFVVAALQKVCGHPQERAIQLTTEAHTKGRAIVWTGSLEVAELKRDQLRSMGPDFDGSKPIHIPLGVVIEPLPLD